MNTMQIMCKQICQVREPLRNKKLCACRNISEGSRDRIGLFKTRRLLRDGVNKVRGEPWLSEGERQAMSVELESRRATVPATEWAQALSVWWDLTSISIHPLMNSSLNPQCPL